MQTSRPTLPPVHIALFGFDKIVATLDDAVASCACCPAAARAR